MANLADFFSQQPTMTDQTATTQPGGGNLLLQLSQLMQQPKPAMAAPGGGSDLLSQFQMPAPMGPGQAILQALSTAQQQQPVGPSGGMLGGIAQGLAPLAQALTQAPQLQAQSQMNNLVMRLKLMQVAAEMQKAQGDPEKRAADLAKIKAETAKIQKETAEPPKEPALTDNAILQGVLANDPKMMALNNLKQQQRQQNAAFLSDQMVQRSSIIQENHDAEKERARLDAPAASKGTVVFSKDDLSTPSKVTNRELEDPNSPYVKVSEKAALGLRGAKFFQQAIDRMRGMIPELLSDTPVVGPPITLAQNKMDQQKTRKAAQFDTLSNIDSLVGIKDFIALRGANQAEIHNVGPINRAYDTQAAAQGKLDAWENTIADTLHEYGINPNALRSSIGRNVDVGAPTTTQPQTMGLVPRPQPTQTPIAVDFGNARDNRNMAEVFRNLQEQYPDKTASQLVDIYQQNLRH